MAAQTVEELAGWLDDLPATYERAVEAGLYVGAARAVDVYKDVSVDERAFNTGEFISRWQWAPLAAAEPAAIVYNDSAYAKWIHLGRRPGGRLPPLIAILVWAEEKFGTTETIGSVWPLAKKIARDGIKPKPILTIGLARATGAVLQAIWSMLERIR